MSLRIVEGDFEQLTVEFPNRSLLEDTHPLKANGFFTPDFSLYYEIKAEPADTTPIVTFGPSAFSVLTEDSAILTINAGQVTIPDSLPTNKVLFHTGLVIQNTDNSIVFTLQRDDRYLIIQRKGLE